MSQITLEINRGACLPVLYCAGVLFIKVIFCLYSWRCIQSSISACADIYHTTHKLREITWHVWLHALLLCRFSSSRRRLRTWGCKFGGENGTVSHNGYPHQRCTPGK